MTKSWTSIYWGVLRGLATLPTPSPLYHREQASHIGLSLLFKTFFVNRVTVFVSECECESECLNEFTLHTQNLRV